MKIDLQNIFYIPFPHMFDNSLVPKIDSIQFMYKYFDS
jgi:hypothetical protein